MAERYWITGVQLGLIASIQDSKTRQEECDVVTEKQFIGNYPTDKDKDRFLLQIKALQMEEIEKGRK